MTTQTVNKVSIQLTGVQMKQIQSLYKGHKHNKKYPTGNHLHFSADGNKLTISYTNVLENIYSHLHIESDCAPITFLLPIDTIKTLSATKGSNHIITLADTHTAELNSNGITQRITIPVFENFLSDPFADKTFDQIATLTPETFNKIKVASLSVSKSLTRPILNTVLIRNNKVVSTDSHRLYMSHVELQADRDIVLHSSIITLMQALTGKSDTITISYYHDVTRLQSDNFTIYHDTKYGNYPDVSRLIPDSFNTIIHVKEYDQFKKALEAIKKANKENSLAILTFNYTNSNMTVSNRDQTIQATINIQSNYFDKEFTTISCSAAYLLDALKQLVYKDITLNFISALRPFVVESQHNPDTLGLILPIRLAK